MLRHRSFVGTEIPGLPVIVYLKYTDRLAPRQHGDEQNRAWQWGTGLAAAGGRERMAASVRNRQQRAVLETRYRAGLDQARRRIDGQAGSQRLACGGQRFCGAVVDI